MKSRDVTRALAAGAFGLLAACHTPQWRVTQIHEENDAFNHPRRDAAVKSAIESNGAVPLNGVPRTIVFRSDMNECRDAESIVETDDGKVLAVGCNALRNAIFSGGAVEAKTEDGATKYVLAATRPLAGDNSGGFVLANGPNGEIFLVRPHMNVVLKRKIWRAGTCDFMPSPVQLPRSVTMFVLPPAVVRTIDVTYDGADTDVICDQRVE